MLFFFLTLSLYIYVYCQEPLCCLILFAWDLIKSLSTFCRCHQDKYKTTGQMHNHREKGEGNASLFLKLETQQKAGYTRVSSCPNTRTTCIGLWRRQIKLYGICINQNKELGQTLPRECQNNKSREQRWWIQSLHKCVSGEEFSYFLQLETGSRK